MLKVLQICFRVPYPPNDGGAIAMFGITRNLVLEGHDVTVLAVNTPKHFYKSNTLEEVVARLHKVFIDTTVSPFKAFKNLFSPLPYIVERFISKEFSSKLTQLLKEEEFDVVHIEGTFVSWYVNIVRSCSKAPVVLRSHNLEFMIWERLAKNSGNPLKRWYFKYMATELKRFELTYMEKFDLIAAITPEDRDRIKNLGVQTRTEFVPAGVDLERFNVHKFKNPKPNTCFILSALNWLPNQEALYWFLENVWPEVSKRMPDLELHVAGKGTPEEILNIKKENVVIHGFVEDAFDFINSYELMLVPLLSGGGMRLKIVEGMALGKCILSSSIGAEGIGATSGENILIEDEPKDWVNLIVDYYNNKEKYNKIGKNARKFVEERYSNRKVIRKLVNLYQSLLH